MTGTENSQIFYENTFLIFKEIDLNITNGKTFLEQQKIVLMGPVNTKTKLLVADIENKKMGKTKTFARHKTTCKK